MRTSNTALLDTTTTTSTITRTNTTRTTRWKYLGMIMTLLGILFIIPFRFTYKSFQKGIVDQPKEKIIAALVGTTTTATAAAANTTITATTTANATSTTTTLTATTMLHEHQRPFPRWDDTGISITNLITFMNHVLVTVVQQNDESSSSSRSGHQQHHLPTALYIIDDNYQLWTYQPLKQKYIPKLKKRIEPSEQLALLALHMLQQHQNQNTAARRRRRAASASSSSSFNNNTNNNHNNHRWMELESAIKKGGFPFLVYHKDFTGCNTNNLKRLLDQKNNDLIANANASTITESPSATTLSVPMFTFCGRVDCNHSFPWPTYKSISIGKHTKKEWEQTFRKNQRQYSSTTNNNANNHTKIPQVIWRGSPTGGTNKLINETNRWKLCQLSNQYPTMINAKFVSWPKKRQKELQELVVAAAASHEEDEDEDDKILPPLLAPIMDMMDYQKYIAILDIDGNAWSSRFADLLCMDSIVLKVEPIWVDYFYFQPILHPWIHYIPIQSDLSNLISTMEWVISHPIETRTIIQNANHWCSTQLLYSTLAYDLLDIWNTYIIQLHKGDENKNEANNRNRNRNWNDIWNQELQSINSLVSSSTTTTTLKNNAMMVQITNTGLLPTN